jgi:hypothetical protein
MITRSQPAPMWILISWPAEQVIEVTRLRDSETTLVHLGWHELRRLLFTQSVLLVLRNGNVATALENSANVVVEEIVASDPLYWDGGAFVLPRNVLEAAWDGAALVVRHFPAAPKAPFGRSFRRQGCAV